MERFTGHEKAKTEGQIGDHFSNLYDEDADQAGQTIDEATGKRLNNSPVVEGADERLQAFTPDQNSEDVLGKLPQEDDAAAKWLRDNDPDQRKAV